MSASFARPARHVASVLVALAALVQLSPSFACGTPQTQILSVGETKKDKRCNYDTIQQAIDAATCVGTTIVITRQHAYTAQKLRIKDKSLLLAGASQCGVLDANYPPSRTTIDGNGNGGTSVISIEGSGDIALQNLWITGGKEAGGFSGGGGISATLGKGSLTLDNVAVVDNAAAFGGGIYMYADSGSLDLGDNVLIEFNDAISQGGGVAIEGGVTMTFTGRNSSIYSNTANQSSRGGYGGGIAAVQPARINFGAPGLGFGGVGAIEGNSAVSGGGIALLGDDAGCTAALQMFTTDPANPTTIGGNVALRDGGALYLSPTLGFMRKLGTKRPACVPGKDQVDLHDFRLVRNSAPDGAAIGFSTYGGLQGDDNLGGGSVLNFNLTSLSEAGVTRYGAVACARNVECNAISDNVSQQLDPKTQKATATDGATISVQDGFRGLIGPDLPEYLGVSGVRLTGLRFSMRRNRAGNLIANTYDGLARQGMYHNDLRFQNCLLADNALRLMPISDFKLHLEPDTSTSMMFDSCTIAGNAIAADVVVAFNTTFGITNSIVSQPGIQAATICADCGVGILNATALVGENLTGLDSSVTSVQADPQFIDRASGDYMPREASPAVDFIATSSPPTDLQGNPRSVDLFKFNQFGPRDAGALERQLNVAAASSGATAVASSTIDPVAYPPSAAIDGDRTALNGVDMGFWNDATIGAFPDSLQINFNAMRQIGRIDVYSLQNNYIPDAIDPTDTLTGSAYVLKAFDVQYLDGLGNWVTAAQINGNTLIKREVLLPATVMTSAIRVLVRGSADNMYSRIVEVEAFDG